jgi:hypothetical protein
VINENDPQEQQKRLRYIDLVALAVILQNTADMMKAVEGLIADGFPVNEADLAHMSPYGRQTRRFGTFELDMKKPPEPWLREALFRQAAKEARQASDRMGGAGKPANGKKGRK